MNWFVEGLRAEVGRRPHFHVERSGRCRLASVKRLGSHIRGQLKQAVLFPQLRLLGVISLVFWHASSCALTTDS